MMPDHFEVDNEVDDEARSCIDVILQIVRTPQMAIPPLSIFSEMEETFQRDASELIQLFNTYMVPISQNEQWLPIFASIPFYFLTLINATR
jgi:hypothetical protein